MPESLVFTYSAFGCCQPLGNDWGMQMSERWDFGGVGGPRGDSGLNWRFWCEFC